jgi:hypothetical protein
MKYYDDVTYNIIHISLETEEEFYNRGGENYNSFLEWVDDEREEIIEEFNKSSIDCFNEFCLTKWFNEICYFSDVDL